MNHPPHLRPARLRRRLLAGAAGLLASAAPWAAEAPPPAVAVASLVGDVLDIEVRRAPVRSRSEANDGHFHPMADPAIDHMVLASIDRQLASLPQRPKVALLTVPAPGTVADPAVLLQALAQQRPDAYLEALHQAGYARLLLVSKLRAPARLRVEGGTLGAGQLQGVGFYIDPHQPIRAADGADLAPGYVAPFVYLQLTLVDLASQRLLGEQPVTEGWALAVPPEAGERPLWESLSAQQKLRALDQLIQRQVGPAAAALVARAGR